MECKTYLVQNVKNSLFPDIYNKIFSKDKGMTAIDESGLITAGTMLNAEFRCPMYFDRFDLLSKIIEYNITTKSYDLKSVIQCQNKCKINNRYPADQFLCPVRIGSMVYGADDLVLTSNFTTASLKDGHYEEYTDTDGQFRMELMNMDDEIHPYFNSTVTGFAIHMSRIITPQLTSVYVPSEILVLASHISFSVPPDNIPGRMSLIVTILLMLINMYGDAHNESPMTTGILVEETPIAFVKTIWLDLELTILHRTVPIKRQGISVTKSML